MSAKSRKWLMGSMSVVLTGSMLLSACSGDKQPTATSSTAPSKSPEAEKPADQLGKYDPPITLTTWGQTSQGKKFPAGDSMENNVWIRAYKELLGIDAKYNWIVNNDQMDQKKTLSIASNELPDAFGVNMKELSQLVDAGKLEDLTPYYEKYASPQVKEWLTADGGIAMKNVTFKGKIYGLPVMNTPWTNSSHLWIRMDWMEKLKLEAPKTVDDLLKIADAFVKQDPDGNGKNDTYAFVVSKELSMAPWAGLDGFFHAHHAIFRNWTKDANGKNIYGSVQPEIKPALQKLQELYKAGYIDKEFGVKDNFKVLEDVVNNKIGMFFGQYWSAGWPIGDKVATNPGLKVKAYPLPSIDGKPVKYGVGPALWGATVVRKGYKNPEAVIKMMNLYVEKVYGKNAEPQKYSYDNDFNYGSYAMFGINDPNERMNDYIAINKALETKDPSKLAQRQKAGYEGVLKYRAGDNKSYNNEADFGPIGVWPYYLDVMKNKQFWPISYSGPATPSQAQKEATLRKMEEETFTKIIMGAASIDEFDKFVEDWKKLGGTQIMKEMDEWEAKQK